MIWFSKSLTDLMVRLQWLKFNWRRRFSVNLILVCSSHKAFMWLQITTRDVLTTFREHFNLFWDLKTIPIYSPDFLLFCFTRENCVWNNMRITNLIIYFSVNYSFKLSDILTRISSNMIYSLCSHLVRTYFLLFISTKQNAIWYMRETSSTGRQHCKLVAISSSDCRRTLWATPRTWFHCRVTMSLNHPSL